MTHYAKGTLLLLFARAAYKTTTSKRSLTVLFTIAYVLYLAFEEGSPNSFRHGIQTVFKPFYLFMQATLFSFTLIIESRLICFPEVNKIFQFTSFIY